MAWLHRMDPRLIKFVQEKFSTELNAGSNILITMVETLSKNIDSYIAILNASRAVGAVSLPNPSSIDSPDQQEARVALHGAYRSGAHGGFHGKAGFPDRGLQPRRGFQSRQKDSGRENQSSFSSCEYCYIQSMTRNIDFNHPIASCPEMAALHGSVEIFDDDTSIFEEHEFETFAQEFIEQNKWHEVATDKNDLENKATLSEHQDLPPINIRNITGIVSDDGSIGTIPWKPVQSPSRPTLCGGSQLSLSQERFNQSQQSTPGNIFDYSIQTIASPTADLSIETKSNDEKLVADTVREL